MDLEPDPELIKYRLRSEANLSLKQLGKRLGKDPSTISMVIHGRRTSAPIMRAISAILDPKTPETPKAVLVRNVDDKEDAA